MGWGYVIHIFQGPVREKTKGKKKPTQRCTDRKKMSFTLKKGELLSNLDDRRKGEVKGKWGSNGSTSGPGRSPQEEYFLQ